MLIMYKTSNKISWTNPNLYSDELITYDHIKGDKLPAGNDLVDPSPWVCINIPFANRVFSILGKVLAWNATLNIYL